MTDYSKMPDEELNEVIAVKKGWKLWSCVDCMHEYWVTPNGGVDYNQSDPPDYTHSWELCGELLEEMAMDGGGISFMTKWHVDYKAGHNTYKMASADTPQRAICEAWLAWKGAE